MKTQTAIAAALLAVASIVSAGSFAADADKAPATEAQAASAKKMKPHSHVEEKGGVVSKAQDAAPTEDKDGAAKSKAGKDKSKHFHPRDGK